MISSEKPTCGNINTAIKAANFTIFFIWTVGLLVQLVFLIKDRDKNTPLSYIAAVGTALTFICYFSKMILEWQREKILGQESSTQESRLVAVENAIKELLPAKSENEGKKNEEPSSALGEPHSSTLADNQSPSVILRK